MSPYLGGNEPAISPQTLQQVRQSLQQWGIQVFVIFPPQQTAIILQYDDAYAVKFVSAVYGRGPLKEDGAWVWLGRPSPGSR